MWTLRVSHQPPLTQRVRGQCVHNHSYQNRPVLVTTTMYLKRNNQN